MALDVINERLSQPELVQKSLFFRYFVQIQLPGLFVSKAFQSLKNNHFVLTVDLGNYIFDTGTFEQRKVKVVCERFCFIIDPALTPIYSGVSTSQENPIFLLVILTLRKSQPFVLIAFF